MEEYKKAAHYIQRGMEQVLHSETNHRYSSAEHT